MFTNNELQFLIEAVNATPIQGKHARLVVGVLDKLEEEQKRESENGDTD